VLICILFLKIIFAGEPDTNCAKAAGQTWWSLSKLLESSQWKVGTAWVYCVSKLGTSN